MPWIDEIIGKHLGLHEQVFIIKLADGFMADLSPKGWPPDVGMWGKGGTPAEALQALAGQLENHADLIEGKASKLKELKEKQ